MWTVDPRPRISLLLIATFAFCIEATGNWTDPAPDVAPNPSCNPSSVIPLIQTPKDVTELHPSHLKFALAIGDSITAGALSKGGPFEYRQISWSGGAGASGHFTMPYLVKQYSGSLDGPALGSFQMPQLGPCCGRAPWWAGVAALDDQLNAALSGGLSSDWELEVKHLTNLVTGKGFGIPNLGGFPKWSAQKQDEYKNSWKVLTIFFGMNDVLTRKAACDEDPAKRADIVTKYNQSMHALFDHLVADPDNVFQKLYINLGMLFDIKYMSVQNEKQGWCEATGASVLKQEFPCMRNGGDIDKKGDLVDEVTKQMNNVLENIAATYDQKRPDFGVNLFQAPANQQILYKDLRSDLDCFHPTAKAHRVLGTELWNSMLSPSTSRPLDSWTNMPNCAAADTKLVTYSQVRAAHHPLSHEEVII